MASRRRVKFEPNFNCPKCGYPMKVTTVTMKFKIPDRKHISKQTMRRGRKRE
jgi:transcription elongation factor Elf1